MTKRSQELFAQAQKIIPGGVNSPVRACSAVGCDPYFIESAKGSTMTNVDGETFVDFVQSWGPMLLGHAHPEVTKALHEAVDKGTSFGAPCPGELELAELITGIMPAMEMVRFVNSGTEATMSAARLARGVTGRDCIIKFEGCYHGHGDAFLASAGSGVATLSIPGTPGVPADVVAHTLLAPFNDLEAVKKLFKEKGNDIAGIIVEPAAGNMGLVLPEKGFLEGLRALCDEYESILIFDEVITGFRLSLGGAQARFGITPDLTTIGKIIGGGLPVGGYGGKRSIMKNIAPSGNVYQAGTLSGNPLAMAAGIATLKVLKESDYSALENRVSAHVEALKNIFAKNNIPVQINQIASLFTVFFTDKPVTNFESAKSGDTERYARYFQHMRANGIGIAPSAFEATMCSFAHSDEDFTKMQKAAESFKG